jgi:integrase/recombinase XerC
MEKHLDFLRLSGYSPATIYARRRALVRLAAVLPVPLCEATPEMLGGWRAGLTITDEAVVSYVSHLRAFYGWCTTEGYAGSNPAAGLPVPRVPRRVPRPIAEDDLMHAVATAAPRVRPWLVLAGWAGLRAKEIACLRRESVLESHSPPVLIVAADATKGRTERVVPLSAFARAELAAARLPPSGFAFRRHDGQPGPNAPWLVSRMCNDHLHDLGIAATLHQCRHRFGTMTYQATRDLRLVQELMGHARPETTARYTAFSQPEALAAVELLPCPGLRVAR